MRKNNKDFLVAFLLNVSVGMFFAFFICFLFNNFSGLYPFFGIALVFLSIGFSSLFFLFFKNIKYAKVKQVLFISLVLVIGSFPFLLKYGIKHFFLVFVFVISFIVASLILLIYRFDIKDTDYRYYFSFAGFSIGIVLYFLIGYLILFFVSFVFLLVTLIFASWYFSYRPNLYFLLFSFSILLLFSVLGDIKVLNNGLYGNFYIKDVEEEVFSKNSIKVKGVFINHNYYTFYFPKEKFGEFRGSLYELIYSKIMNKPSLLVINGGGGADVAAGIYFNLSVIDVIERNPKVIKDLKDLYSAYTGGIYHHRNVMYYRTETFPFLISLEKKYDMIQINQRFYGEKPLTYFSLEYLKMYHKLIKRNGIITFFVRNCDNYVISVLLNTISDYLVLYKKTLYETLRVIKVKKNSYVIIFKPEGFSHELSIIREFCEKNSYDLLVPSKFLAKSIIKKLPTLRNSRSFVYNLWFYNLKDDLLHLKASVVFLISFILIFSLFIWIGLKKKDDLKNVYLSRFMLYFVFSLGSVGFFISSFVYKIWVLFENIPFIFLIIFFAVSFFTLLFYVVLRYKIRLKRTSIFLIHSIFILSLIAYLVWFEPLISLVASYGFIFRVLMLFVICLPLFISCFSFVFFSVEWAEGINENTFFLSVGSIFGILGISLFLGCILNIFLSFDIVWIFSILLEVFALLTFLKLDWFYRKTNYMYRRYGI